MQVRFWGTRGSIPSPGARTAKYGGNTSCVEIRTDGGTHIILDCGSGARELGEHLLRSSASSLRINILVGHTHWDHIQGFPFFVPAFLPQTDLNIYAPRGFQHNLEESLAGQMQHSYFPVKLRELRSHIHFTELEEGFFRVEDVLIETQHLNHTAPTIAYRITCDGATVAYTTDHEPFWRAPGADLRHPGDQRHVAFLKGADLVVHDAQYTEEEYPNRLGWGHSTVEYATEVAAAAGVGKLALFHHDPTRDDVGVARLEELARHRAEELQSPLEVFAAAEGYYLDVRGTGETPDAPPLSSALLRRPIAGRRVLVAVGDDGERAAIAQELREDNLTVLRAADAASAVSQLEGSAPDLAIVDTSVPGGDVATIIRNLRAQSGRANFPVVLLTEEAETAVALGGGEFAATDYMVKPFSPPMLRTRVRAWLARTVAEADAVDGGAELPLGGSPGVAETLTVPSTQSQLRNLLAGAPIFRELPGAELDVLAERASEHFFAAGQVVIEEGQPSDRLYVLMSGRVRVLEATHDPLETTLVLGELSPGEIVGEVGILTDKPRSATVVAVEPTHCIGIPEAEFSLVLDRAPQLAIGLSRVLAERIYDTDRRLARYAPDPLTALPSRLAFHDHYARLAAQARRRESGVLLTVLDILNLKSINDQFGYAIGDEVIRTVAKALVESARKSDLVARYGGDEFAVLLLDADPNAVERISSRVRRKLADLTPRAGLPLTVECAIGAASSDVPPETAHELFRLADQDMQRRKEVIKNAPSRPARRRPRVRPEA